MRGAAHLFGDNVNTDYITPSDYFGLPLDEIATHAFEPIDKTFVERFEPDDIIVAGDNFGSGSSRETAPAALKELEVGAVVAESFARLYYRNSIAIGLPAVICSGVTENVEEEDRIKIDLEENQVQNLESGVILETEPLADAVREIFAEGGLLEHYEKHPEGLGFD